MIKKKKIIFAVYGQFPDGGAFITRLLGYAKGFEKLQIHTTFLLLAKQRDIDRSVRLFSSEFIHFDNSLCNDISISSQKAKKLYERIVVILKLKKYLKSNKEQIQAVYTYGITFPFTHLLGKYSKQEGLYVVNEQTEYPFAITSNNFFRQLYMRYLTTNLHKYFDGLIVISNSLSDYYSSKLPTGFPINIVNMFVDVERFSESKTNIPIPFPYIAYAGTMSGDKDGVENLIKAYKHIHNKIQHNLVLIGDISNSNVKSMLDRSITKDIKSKVILTGRISSSIVPDYLINADILCLARPKTKQNEGGFPTKLGEYLATGKPVVITDTGEIGWFLKHNKNAYICETDNPEVFGNLILLAINNPDLSKEIGLKGKELTLNEFNYLEQSKRLLNALLNEK